MTIQKLAEIAKTPPINIPDKPFTGPTPAMPDYCKVEGDSLASYRKYYMKKSISQSGNLQRHHMVS